MQSANTEDVDLDIDTEPEPAPHATGEADAAAEAFGRLEREVVLARMAVQQLATQRADIVIPDYEATLVKITATLAALDTSVSQIEQSPALKVTPEDFGQRIAAAARSARAGDADMIQQWKAAAYDHERTISEALGSAATRKQQRQREWRVLGMGLAASAVLMAILPGAVARELPAGWQLPERMARRALGEPTILDAGVRLIQAANPQAWEAISEAIHLSDANRTKIQRCKDMARETKRAVDCLVRIQR